MNQPANHEESTHIVQKKTTVCLSWYGYPMICIQIWLSLHHPTGSNGYPRREVSTEPRPAVRSSCGRSWPRCFENCSCEMRKGVDVGRIDIDYARTYNTSHGYVFCNIVLYIYNCKQLYIQYIIWLVYNYYQMGMKNRSTWLSRMKWLLWR